MKLFFHSIHKATEPNPHLFAITIKAGYLFFDEIISMGIINQLIFRNSYLDKYDIVKRVHIMRRTLDSQKHELEIKHIDHFLNLMNLIKGMKHPTTPVVIAFKKVENKIKKMYDKWFIENKAVYSRLGFDILEPLSDGNGLGYLGVKEDITLKNYKPDFLIELESLIKLDTGNKAPRNNVFVLNDEFYQESVITDHIFVSPLEDAAIYLSNSYVYPVMSFPNLQYYNGTELRAIRNSLTEPLRNFHETVDVWSSLCNTAEDKNTGLLFFKEKIVPVIESINDIVKNHPILKHRLVQSKESNYKLLLGETTKELLLNYYLHFDFIKEEKYQELKSKFIEDNEWDRRVPIMYVSKSDVLRFPEKDEMKSMLEDGEIKSIRKFISLD